MKGIILAILVFIYFGTSSAATDKIVCYFGSWAVYRDGLGKFDVDNIDPKLCTHLIYAFVGLNNDGSVKILDAYSDLDENGGIGGFKRFVNLKNRSPGVKTMIAIGGWSEGGATFSQVVSSSTLRSKFVSNAVKFIQKYKFDGFDLDWEVPGSSERGGRPEDLPNFTSLIKELRTAFDSLGLILTAAVAAPENDIKYYYQIPELSKYLDFINVMTYDYHSYTEGKTGMNAPLYKSSKDVNPYSNVKSSIEGWIKFGADPKKLVLGMGMYGKSYTLTNANNHGLGAPTSGPGNAGKYTRDRGTLGYNEIVELLRDGKMVSVWEDEQKVPYAYGGTQWVGYDNEKSIKLKCDFAKNMKLGGGMIWPISTDDFQGITGTKYSLLRTINSAFGRNV